MIRLTKVTGPECPKCGCTDSSDWGQYRLCRHCGTQFTAPVNVNLCPECQSAWSEILPDGRHKCRAKRNGLDCGTIWGKPTIRVREVTIDVESVRFVVPKEKGATCPLCGANPVPISSAPRHRGPGPRVRYHKCACGWQGKSLEE